MDLHFNNKTETVSRTSNNTFSDHSRSIFHFHKYNNVTPNYIMIDMVLKNKSGISHAQDLQVVIFVSGVKGYQNDVTTIVWDKVYELQNGTLEFQTPEKMTKELIIQDAVNDNNPIIQKRHQNDFNFLNNRFESVFFVFLWSIMN